MKATVLSLLALMLACEGRVYRAELILGGSENDPRGFVCLEDPPSTRQLWDRVQDNNPPVMSMVVDFVRLDGTPGCRVSELVAWCRTHDCLPIPEARLCIDLDIGLEQNPSLAEALIRVRDLVKNGTISHDAPQEEVMIRVYTVAQACADVPKAGDADLDVDCRKLLGCAYSCPVTLGKVDGRISIDFDSLGDRCEQGVVACASSHGLRDDITCPSP